MSAHDSTIENKAVGVAPVPPLPSPGHTGAVDGADSGEVDADGPDADAALDAEITDPRFLDEPGAVA